MVGDPQPYLRQTSPEDCLSFPYHEATNNTVFGGDGGKNHIIVLYENGAGNENSVIWNNAADSIAAHRANDVWNNPLQNDTFGMNWNGYTNGYDASIQARNHHSCAVYENGSLYCWGRNNYFFSTSFYMFAS